MDLTCPKCHGAMRAYERNGVTVDQCTECRGIFLDRGELERLSEAESQWYEPAARPDPRPQPRYDDRDDREHRYDDRDHRYDDRHSGHHGGYKKKRKKSFFDDLFD